MVLKGKKEIDYFNGHYIYTTHMFLDVTSYSCLFISEKRLFYYQLLNSVQIVKIITSRQIKS